MKRQLRCAVGVEGKVQLGGWKFVMVEGHKFGSSDGDKNYAGQAQTAQPWRSSHGAGVSVFPYHVIGTLKQISGPFRKMNSRVHESR